MVASANELEYACNHIEGEAERIDFIMGKHPGITRRDAQKEIRAYSLLQAIMVYCANK